MIFPVSPELVEFIFKIIILIIRIIIFHAVVIMFSFIEYPTWGRYKKQGYLVPNYLKFVWQRHLTLSNCDYKKR